MTTDDLPAEGKGPPRTWLGFARDQFLVFLFLVAFPGFVTAVAPVSWIRLERHGDQTFAVVHRCMFFVVPYRTDELEHVIGVDDQFVQGETRRDAVHQRNESTEDQAYLVLHGRDGSVRVEVSPVSIEGVRQRAKDFLADPQATVLHMTVVANWKFSVIVGGFVSLLTVLYLVGIASCVVEAVRRLASFPDEAQQGGS